MEPIRYPVVDAQVLVLMAKEIQSAVVTPRKVEDRCSQIAPLSMISALVARLLRTAQEGQPAEVKVTPEEEVKSVNVRDGQYRASWIGGTKTWSSPGNEGWSGREGQPPGPSGINVRLTRRGRGWFEKRPAGVAAAGGVGAWSRVGFKHTSFSAVGEPTRRTTWTG